MTKTTKITKKDRYTEMSVLFTEMGRKDLAEFCDHEIELLAKKNASKSKVSTAEQTVRDAIATAAISILENSAEPLPCADIVKAMPNEVACNSTQKLTPILAKLIESGAITTAKVKGRTVYSIA